MPHALVEGYVAERDQLLNTISVFKNTAADQKRDPSEPELDAMDKAFKRIDKLDEMIKIVGEDRTMSDETRAKLLSTPATPEVGGIKYRSAGEMVWDCLHAQYGSQQNSNDQDAKRRWDRVMKRAAEHMGTGDGSQTTPVAGGVGGLYVVPVVGPVIDLYPKGQPFLTAIGRRPAPDAMSFTRPRIVDPDFRDGAGPQTLQKGELTSKKFDIKVDTVGLATVGGYLNVSQQLMSLQPSGWDLIVAQLQKRVAYQGEASAIAEVNQTTAHVALAAGTTDPAAVLSALYDAAALVYQNTNELPSWIAYGAGGWAMLGKLVDAAGRPLFPFLGAANAFGQGSLADFSVGPLGLQQVVTPAIGDTNIYMGNDYALEAYVYSFPILEAPEPALLGRQIAVAEAMAFYRPTTKEAGPANTPPAEQDGAVRIGP
jgi:hypothetical protein